MNHEYYMQMALDLARKGFPNTAPNPLVGCVIVKKDEVVATGYHMKYGEAHAEVNAIAGLPKTVNPAECLLYVTLEPCNHQGKTPPCADLIIKRGFKTVVIACKDPNPLVSGSGIKKLLESGAEVITGILEKEAMELNRHFITFYEKKRPYIILKWAQTADGFIGRIPAPKNREERMITRTDAQVFVHKLRSEVMAILVGKNTVSHDNPSLTTRLVEGRNPTRIFIDKNLEVPKDFNVYNQQARTIVFNAVKSEVKGHIQFIKLDFNKNLLEQICAKLYALNILSLLVEGGAFLVNDFVQQELWDEVLVFQNPDLNYGEGLKAPVFALKNSFELVGNDKLFRHYKNETMPKGEITKEIF